MRPKSSFRRILANVAIDLDANTTKAMLGTSASLLAPGPNKAPGMLRDEHTSAWKRVVTRLCAADVLEEAAVGEVGAAGDVGGVVGGEEEDDVGDLLGLAGTAHRDALQRLLPLLG